MNRHRLKKAKVDYGNRANGQEEFILERRHRKQKEQLGDVKTLVQKNESNCKSSAMSLDIKETFSDPSVWEVGKRIRSNKCSFLGLQLLTEKTRGASRMALRDRT